MQDTGGTVVPLLLLAAVLLTLLDVLAALLAALVELVGPLDADVEVLAEVVVAAAVELLAAVVPAPPVEAVLAEPPPLPAKSPSPATPPQAGASTAGMPRVSEPSTKTVKRFMKRLCLRRVLGAPTASMTK